MRRLAIILTLTLCITGIIFVIYGMKKSFNEPPTNRSKTIQDKLDIKTVAVGVMSYYEEYAAFPNGVADLYVSNHLSGSRSLLKNIGISEITPFQMRIYPKHTNLPDKTTSCTCLGCYDVLIIDGKPEYQPTTEPTPDAACPRYTSGNRYHLEVLV